MTSAVPASDRRRARRNYAWLKPTRASIVRLLVFAGAVLLIGVIQGALFVLLGGTGYEAPVPARPMAMKLSSG